MIVVSYDACLRLSEYLLFFLSVRQVSRLFRGVNGYGAVTIVSARRLGFGVLWAVILVTYLIQLTFIFTWSFSSPEQSNLGSV